MRIIITAGALAAALALATAAPAGAQSWERRGRAGEAIVRSLEITDGAIVAASDAGLLRSTDGGVTWELRASGPFSSAVALDGADLVAATIDGRMLRSTDAGLSWNPRFDGLPPLGSIRSIARAGDSIVIATSLGVYRVHVDSTLVEPLPAEGLGTASVWGLGVASDGIAAATYGGPAMIAASDSAWRGPDDPPAFVFALERHGGRMYAGTLDGIHASTDDGVTWSRHAADSAATFVLLAVGPRVVAGTEAGVFVAGASGRWTTATEGLPDDPVHALVADATTIWAATSRGEIFRRPLETFSRVDDRVAMHDALELRVMPVPATDRLVVRWTSARASTARVRLFDVRGAEVASTTIASGVGAHAIELSIGHLPSGIYRCVVTEGEAGATRIVSIAR